ncbi:MinD/ParA family ATP-binding protein [Nonomuraea gerenzanensis]|uniref:Proline and alanine rich protein EspI, component of Type VII secretion system ESX-1 n=1 Tax=Nonomuraea gerenzanensis TaxID=93944 RepID=A0A1M4DXK1_9ACTN|nr:MinD/ParA family protein [Nonomuraea gerenzanensis]UBU13623.1 AAA family ATPase [Nonomuraea gerenzanensis]SBO91289.1 Proline and alanine rich protein EspI, component of Type VII secretion system ESX-1 [Nonomuraea gerenzanensis]
MARHDREESLEEQLAWLDAIKETEEAPVSVSASAAAADEPIASPYPKDPWALVPQHHDTPTPPLFRAAVDSVYGAEAAEEVPERESEAGEWLGRAAVKEEPPAPADDPFHAPLKPLPRPDDTDAYPSLSFTPPEQVTSRPEETAWPPAGEETAWVTPPDWPRPAADESGSGSGPVEETAAPADRAARTEEEPARGDGPVEEKVAWADTQPGNERPFWETQTGQAEEEAAPPQTLPRVDLPSADLPRGDASRTDGPHGEATYGDTRRVDARRPEASFTDAGHTDAGHTDAGHTDAGHTDAGHTDEGHTEGRADEGRADAAHGDAHRAEPPHTDAGRADAQRADAQRADSPPWAESSETLPRSDRPQWNDPDARAGQDHRLTWSEQQDRSHWTERSPDRTGWADQPEDRPQWADHGDDRPQWTEQPEWRPAERDIPPAPRRRPAPTPVFTAPARPPVTGRPTAESLDPESLLRGRRNAPSKGWRRLIYKASGGWIKPGESPEVRRRRELVTRARTPVTAGHHRVAVLSLKGGVGKTTTTVGLGATLAQMRGDRVIAVDANPDRGTLSDKLVLETSATVRDLLNERDQVKRYVDIRAFTSQAPSRLEVLASDRDPSVSEAFSGADYQAVSQVLENFYSICITDCGTGLLHSAMGGVLGLADQIVLVSSPSVDGARAASATLDWLEAHHYADLVKNATVVLCSVRPRSKSAVDIKKLEAHFAARCRAVIRVPYDPHLEEGAEIDLDRLQEPTRDAYLQLAACVGDGFAGVME